MGYLFYIGFSSLGGLDEQGIVANQGNGFSVAIEGIFTKHLAGFDVTGCAHMVEDEIHRLCGRAHGLEIDAFSVEFPVAVAGRVEPRTGGGFGLRIRDDWCSLGLMGMLAWGRQQNGWGALVHAATIIQWLVVAIAQFSWHEHAMKKKSARSQPLSARAQAHALLMLVLGEKRTMDEAVAKSPLSGAEADQRFAMLLALTALQHLGQIDAVLARYLDKPLPTKRLSITNALRLGVVQLLLLDTPAHAAVNETVALVKTGKDAGLAGLVNAVLQKIVREKPTLPAPIENLPAWLRARWEQRYGAENVATMADVAVARAPLDVQSAADMEGAERLDTFMVRFNGSHLPVEQLAGYDAGAFFIQDIAASYPVRMLGDVKDRQVLDMCAAPGGKAMQMIQAGGFVTAIDRSAPRMKIVKENLKRMGMQANTIVADAFAWQPSRAYDAILLDAPCTATGTWRRHPEVVQQVTLAEIAEMAELQRALLMRAWAWLKPGGTLVYCVCSLEPEEGETQAAWFMAQQADASLALIPEGSGIPAMCMTDNGLRTTPAMMAEQGGMDGFFAACFRKAA